METFPDDPVHNDPGEQEKAEEVGLDLPDLGYVLAHVEHFVTGKFKCFSLDIYSLVKAIKESFESRTSF